MIPIIETDRVLLRAFNPADAPFVEELAGDKRVAETTLTIPHPYPTGSAINWIMNHKKRADQKESYIFAVEEKKERKLIGTVTLRLENSHKRAEIAYWFGVPFWGKGYATEAVSKVIEFGFDRIGLNRIWATVMKKNIASSKVLIKNGFNHEGTFPKHDLKWGNFEDVEYYGLLHNSCHYAN
ncbi:GNAT family N-acetyltransferase [Bacillus salitolerans]|uniref:GNAT family N-acetyltransferase n=1 Tax=Bacillus salitolerans TaxID=1437434 RepID=A0ABW4LUZ9_9BACI